MVWISLTAIVVAAVVALSTAYLHRKQMRQIALHRDDPTIPLVPPPHSFTHFFKTYWFYLAFVTYNLASLIWTMRQTTPVTRGVVFDIVTYTFGIVLMIVLGFVNYILDRALEALKKLRKTTEESNRIEGSGN